MHVCMYIHAHNYMQTKCVQYWPKELHDSITPGDKFSVTYTSTLPFAEYEIRKFKLKNVSREHQLSNIISSSTCIFSTFILPLSIYIHSSWKMTRGT